MIRHLLNWFVLLCLLALSIGAYRQSFSSDEAAQPGWSVDSTSPQKVVTTPLLSVRRIPDWLVAPVSEAELVEAFQTAIGQEVGAGIELQTCLVAYRDYDVVIEQLGDTPLVPASLLKIITAAAFLETVGTDFRYTTKVYARSSDLNAVDNGTLSGDIYLVGGGDPVLSTPRYIENYSEALAYTDITELANAVSSKLSDEFLVTRIAGSVIADESRYPEAERDYSTLKLNEEDIENVWRSSLVRSNNVGSLSALLVNDGYAYDPSGASPLYSARNINVRASEPPLQAATLFDDLLEEREYVITRKPQVGVLPSGDELILENGGTDEMLVIGEIQSPTAIEIVTRMLRYSDNTTAEMLFKEVGWQAGIGTARSVAVFAVRDAVAKLIDLTPELIDVLEIVDGSGLSSYNKVTCRIIAELLRSAGADSPLVQGLAVAGESGTLDTCEAGTPVTREVLRHTDDKANGAPSLGSGTTHVSGKLWAKTGTLNDVTALAGVTVAVNGEVIVFSLIVNGDNIIASLPKCNIIQRGVMEAALGYPHGPLSSNEALYPKPIKSLTGQ